MEEIIYLEEPKLHRPVFVVGFEGWPNAAEVSSSVLQSLIEKRKAKPFASIPMESFCQLSSARPVAVIKGGRLKDLKIPGNHLYFSTSASSTDLVLLKGIEPHLRWTHFAELLLDLAERFEVSRIYTVGGTYDYIPHTYPPMVSTLFNHDDLRETVVHAGLGLTEYNGPISIHTFLLEAARKRGLRAISLWGHAPQYLQAKNVKVVLAVLKQLVTLTGMELDLEDLERASDYFDQQVNHLVTQDPKLQEVISKLEEVYKRTDRPFPFAKEEEEPKEDKVVYIQAFLKRQEDDEKKES